MHTTTRARPRRSLRPSATLRRRLPAALAALPALLGLPAAFAVSYTAVDLGTLGGNTSYATGVNDAGQVTGTSQTGTVATSFSDHAFRYSGGVMTDLGALDRPNNVSLGIAINAAGQSTGSSYVGSNGMPPHAFRAAGGTLTDLGTLGGSVSYGTAIGDAGQVAGYSVIAAGAQHAFLAPSGGAMADLGTLGGFSSRALGVNASGQVVGWSYLAGNTVFDAFLYSGGTMTDLGALGGTGGSRAFGINNAGQVTGWATNATNSAHAFLYSGGTMTDLGTLGGGTSQGYAINASGQVVGVSSTGPGNGPTHPFLFTGGAMVDLTVVTTAPGVTNLAFLDPNTFDYGSGNSINAWGQIAASGTVGGRQHALLLNPTTPFTTGTPGSQTAMVIAGMGYALVPSVTAPTGLHSTAQLLGGTAAANRQVTLTFTGGGNFGGEASDTLSLSGTGGDPFVLQLSYDPALPGGAASPRLLWLDPADSTWKNAVLGNSNAPTMGLLGDQGDGAYDPAADFTLGNYGIDTASHTVWAVLDHNSAFGVGNLSAVPEPAATTFVFLGLGLLFASARRRRDHPRTAARPGRARYSVKACING